MLNGLLVIKPGLKSDRQDFDQNLQCVFSKQSGTIYSMPVSGRWTLAKLLASLLHDTHKLRLVSQPEGKCRPYVKLESVKRIVYSSHCLHHTYIYICNGYQPGSKSPIGLQEGCCTGRHVSELGKFAKHHHEGQTHDVLNARFSVDNLKKNTSWDKLDILIMNL